MAFQEGMRVGVQVDRVFQNFVRGDGFGALEAVAETGAEDSSAPVPILLLLQSSSGLQVLMLKGRRHAINLGRSETKLRGLPSPRRNRLPYLRCDLTRFVQIQFEIRRDIER